MSSKPEIEDVSLDEEELQEALSVLAGSDPDNCSYSRGYVKRQAVFACNTCSSSASEPAGICLACANCCHDGHDILELYTKRNFRCDCGNSKFGEFRCKLTPVKDEKNLKNLYNHNYSGTYCSCARPYPDEEDQVNDEMIQCVVCEDWFHGRHLGGTPPDTAELQEMVCQSCMNAAPFLWTYAAHHAIPPVAQPEPEQEVVDVEGQEEGCEPTAAEELSAGPQEKSPEASLKIPSVKRTHEEATVGSGCRLEHLQKLGPERQRHGAVFWPSTWRSKLCTCTSCKRVYVDSKVSFLLDPSDSLVAYETRGVMEPFGKHPLLALTESMDRVQQLEIIYGYNELTTAVTEFLHQCAAEGKEVTVEDVHQCFEKLQDRKRRRLV
ncbi:putative E3 ubiquitin-protein ligase UBR7 [Neosynchiropus ocellatus]